MRAWILFIAVLVALVAPMPSAFAQSCTSTVTNVSFGVVDLLAGAPIMSSGSLSIACTGGTPSATALACPRFSQGSGGGSGDIRSMTNGGSGSVNFNVFRDSSVSQVWGGTFGTTTAPSIAIPLDASGAGSVSGITVYGAIYGGQNLAFIGSYASTIPISTLSGYTSGSCGTGATTAGMFMVTATYDPTCTLATASLDFGSITSLASAVDGQTNLTVACSNGSPYSIALDGGLAVATDPTLRRMTRASNAMLYGLYRDGSRSLPWGSTIGAGGNVLGSTGNGSPQLHPVYGRIGAQSTPPPGTYADTIVVTVTN